MIKEQINEMQQEIYRLAGREFDIDSDKELAKVLFEDMGLPPVMKGKNGYLVNDDALWPLIDYPIVAAIWVYRNLQIAEKIPAGTCVIERDDRGRIVGWGSHADYDTHAVDVMNGNGYYDENGRYHSYGNYD